MIEEYYPQAHGHLQKAQQAKAEMASLWGTLLDGGLAEESVVTHPDGSGVISAWLAWPAGRQEELTELFRGCVQELWACLDALVEESVEAFSVLQRVRRPEQPRFFPIADSPEGLKELLAESCMDGTLRSHVAMVQDCQPFQSGDSNEIVDRLRTSLGYLVAWEAALAAGAVIGAWATPVEPQVHVESPVAVQSVEAEPPGALDAERVLARYQLGSFRPGSAVEAQAGTYIDLCFAEGFAPASVEDTFDRRLTNAVEAATRFAVSFAWLSSKVPGSRRVLPGPGLGDGDTWVEAARSSRRWSSEELAGLASSDIGLGRVEDADTLILMVSAADGVYERVVPNATPLRGHARRGTAAEVAVQDAAATWGLPDFVMVPSVERKGRGVREISDGLLIVGGRGVVVQIKAREGVPGAPEKESSWVLKQLAAAAKQISGTVRRLKTQGVQMTTGRGRSVRIDSPAVNWIGVIIIEHPAPPPNLAITTQAGATPVIALLRRDWEFLFNQLRSTHAVVGYLHRIGTSTPVLGGEPERYYELAAADAAASPGPINPSWIRRGGQPCNVPLLPAAPAGSDNDKAHTMVRIVLEDVATSLTGPDEWEPWQIVLASLDSLPVGYRTDLGRFLLDGLDTVTTAEAGATAWRMRTFIAGPDQDQLGFAVCSALTDHTRAAFSAWLQLRHHERGKGTDLASLTSVGVLLTPRTDGYREWDTTVQVINGDPELSTADLRVYRDLWNKGQEGVGSGSEA
ncbi:hypothetical protein [Streptomyces uncialis]|uniref:hypothetical protein n=1 Tax=Streptomyces uncialis TaxID=1048205 RepID=UPI00224FEB02|nr:hypothetical protein [Streptomyces uncialis]MCX4657653.1 hypothetical protein [Streptomyces uncialis]MCX4661540.1 hypothetical protein [Streptomyces uncialis]